MLASFVSSCFHRGWASLAWLKEKAVSVGADRDEGRAGFREAEADPSLGVGTKDLGPEETREGVELRTPSTLEVPVLPDPAAAAALLPKPSACPELPWQGKTELSGQFRWVGSGHCKVPHS